MVTYERLETVNHPLFSFTPVLWRCGELRGIDHVEFRTPLGGVIRWPALPTRIPRK